MNKSITLLVIAIFLTCTSYGDDADVQLEAHRLERSELQSWIAKELKTGRALTFASNEGEGLCCDVGSVTLEINRDHSITMTANYIAGIGFSLPYAIQADGKISLASNSEYPVPALQNIHVRDLYVYRYGSSVYVVRDSDTNPAFGKHQYSIWPLKYAPKGKRRARH